MKILLGTRRFPRLRAGSGAYPGRLKSWWTNLCGVTYLIRAFRGIILRSAGPGTGSSQGRP